MKFRVGLIAFIVLVVLIGAGMFLLFPRGGTKNGIYFKTYDGVYAKITGSVIGNANDITLSDLTYGDGAVPTGEDLSSWQVELEFGEEDEIIILINVENKNTDSLYVIFKDDGQAINNVSKTIKNNGELYNSGRVIMLQSNNDTTLFTVTFKRDQDVITNIRYNYHIELKAEITDDDIKDGSVECEEDTGYTYTFNDSKNTATIKGIKDGNTQTTLVLPSMVVHNNQMYIITTIGQNAFKNKTTITSVVISSTVTELKASVFEGCTNLTNVTIPTSVTKMGNKVFKDCSRLQSIELPDTILTLGANVFNGCTGIKSLVIPMGIKNASATTVSGLVNLESLTIPVKLTTLGDSMFNELTSLKSVVITSVGDVGTSFYCNETIETIEMMNGISNIGNNAFYGCTHLSRVTIPVGVINIGDQAFGNCENLTEIIIPNGVTSIGNGAFNNDSNLTNISLPATIEKVGKQVFDGCDNLGFSIYNNAKYLGNINNPYLLLFSANNNEILDCIIHEGCRIIYNNSFFGCSSLMQLSVPNTIKYIGDSAFSGCSSLLDIPLPENLTEIGANAFNGCTSLTEITIPTSLRFVGMDAFRGSLGINKVIIHDMESWLKISFSKSYYDGTNPLEYAKHLYLDDEEVTSVNIPDSITQISRYAFKNAVNIIRVVIPQSVTEIGEYAFSGCVYLVEVYNLSSISLTIGDYRNGAVAQNAKVIYTDINTPSSIKSINGIYYYTQNSKYIAFKLADQSLTNVTFDENCTKIERIAFNDCENIQTLSINKKINEIGERAFCGCNNLGVISFDDVCSIIKIGEGAFAYTSIQSFSMPDSVQTIGAGCFDHCQNLSSVYIGSGLKSIFGVSYITGYSTSGYSLFSNCPNLTSIIVSEQNTVLDSRDNCNAIIRKSDNALLCGCNVSTIPDSVERIENGAFYACTLLTSVVIGSGVTYIGIKAFSDCSNLSDVFIPDSVIEIDKMAFMNCIGICHIYIPSSVTRMKFFYIGDNPFFGCSKSMTIYLGASTIPQDWGTDSWDRQYGWRLVEGYDKSSAIVCKYKTGYTRQMYLDEVS